MSFSDVSEDNRTLWVGNLEPKVTEELIFELLLQAGPIERLVFPTEGQGEEKKHKGHAYVVFKHADSVQYSTQVMDGTILFDQLISLKARSLPITYKKESPSNVPSIMNANKGRFDNSSLGGRFNRGQSRWQQQDNLSPQAKGNFRQRGVNNYNQGYNNTGYNNYNNQVDSSSWLATQQGASTDNLQDKRQRILQQQNVLIDAHRQMQPQQQQMMYQQQQYPMQQQQQWVNNAYNWNMTANYQQTFQTDQYGQYYPQQ